MTPRITTDDFAYRIDGAPPIDHDTTAYAYLMGFVPASVGSAQHRGRGQRDPRMVSSGFMQRIRQGMRDFECERRELENEPDIAF